MLDCLLTRRRLRQFRWLDRPVIGALAVAGAAASLAAVAGYAFQVEPAWLDVVRVDIPVPGLPRELDGLVIAQLSDFHVQDRLRPDDAAVQAVAVCNAVRPDVVVLTGDYVISRRVLPYFTDLLKELKARPIIAVLGNHDYRHGPRHRRALIDAFAELDITLLQNQSIGLKLHGGKLWFVGVGDGYTSHDQIDHATRELGDADFPRILLTHYPDVLPDYPRGEFALALAGHTHGAQINLPIVSRAALARSDTHFSHGLYWINETPLYVNRGLGMSGYQVRLFARPELTLLTLRGTPRRS
jgi:predicted MPP superfamily phosphohydrolase